VFKTDSLRKGLTISILVNIASKGLSFLVNILIANFFAVGEATDIFFYSNVCIVLVVTLFTNMDSAVVIPEFMRLEAHKGTDESKGFFNTYFFLVLAILSVCVFIFLLVPAQFFNVFSNFSSGSIEQNLDIIYLIGPVLLLQTVSAILNDLLASRKYFVMPMLVSLFNSLLVIGGVVLFHNHGGLAVVFWANIVAFSITLVIQCVMCFKILAWKLEFRPIQSAVLKDIVYANLGVFATMFSTFLPIYLLSSYGEGQVTSLNLGQRIAEVPNMLVVAQVLTVVGTQFNNLFVTGMVSEINLLFQRVSKMLLFVLVPVASLSFLLSDNIVDVLFAIRSTASGATDNIAFYFKVLILASPFYALNAFVSRLFMASRRISYSFYFQILANGLLAIFTYISIKYLGPHFYPWAYLIFFMINFFAWEVLIRAQLPFIEYKTIFSYLIILVVVNAAVGFVMWLIFANVDVTADLVRIIIVSASYLAFLLPISYLLNLSPELAELITRRKKII
jgi:putative peptidoglycan lipid II flippase